MNHDTPRCRHVYEADPVVVGELLVSGVAQDLKLPEIYEEKNEEEGEDGHCHRDLPLDARQRVN